MKKLFTLLAALVVLAAANAQTDLIISEYVEGWSNNKALEIYNPTNAAINLSGYQLVRYANGEDTPPADDNWSFTLPDYELEPYKVFVAVLDKRNPDGTGQDAPVWIPLQDRADGFFNPNYNISNTLYFNGDDAIAIEKTDGTLVDLFARWGAPAPADVQFGGSTKIDGAWTDVAPYYTGDGVGITGDHTLVRKSSVKDGITENPVLFNALAEYDSLPANTFLNLGWHKFDGAPANTLPTLDLKALYAVDPLAEEGDVVLTLAGQDADAGQTLEYYLVDAMAVYVGEGDDAVRHEPFVVDKTTGELRVADELAIAEATKDLWVKVVVCDEYGQSDVYSFDVRVTSDDLAVNDIQRVVTKISPNPTQDNFVIEAAELINEVKVYSLTGQEVYAQLANSNHVSIDTDLQAGSYLVKTTFAGGKQGVDKLIVK